MYGFKGESKLGSWLISIARCIIAYKGKGADAVDRVYCCNSEDDTNIADSPSLNIDDINEKGYPSIHSR